jgi:hypothetical protein
MQKYKVLCSFISVLLYSVGAIYDMCNCGLLFAEKWKDFQNTLSFILESLHKIF